MQGYDLIQNLTNFSAGWPKKVKRGILNNDKSVGRVGLLVIGVSCCSNNLNANTN